VELIGLGEGNKKPLGRLKNDVKRSLRKTFSAKTRDILKDVEPRLSVCMFICTLFVYLLIGDHGFCTDAKCSNNLIGVYKVHNSTAAELVAHFPSAGAGE
jgi:hypothetical protein